MNDLKQKLDSGINKGISFLSENQFENGQFRGYISNNDDMLVYEGSPAGWVEEEGLVFLSTLIGISLEFLMQYPGVEEILNKITHFLLSQRKAGSAWNHYTPDHVLYKLCSFDVDDTAYASVFLKARGVDFPSNVDLLRKNINRKKLYYTWFTFGTQFSFNLEYWRLVLRELKRPIKSFLLWKKSPCNRDDVDAVVNANVLYYLPDAANAQVVIDYLLDIIKNEKEAHCDKWYGNVFTVYFSISRNYYAGITKLEPARQAIIDRILKKVDQSGRIGDSVLDTALAICTLLNFNYDNKSTLAPAIQYILDQQAENGSWARRAYYFDNYDHLKMVCWGGEELTTGFCLEALARYKKDNLN
ncbi:MAG: hypothetical protein JWQ79_1917 [Mucilaginibacter sp.]|jgi:hypothetical protein|nr:hypothetical protein [Mucilaginibacter sp.]